MGDVTRVLEGEANVDLVQDPALLEVALDGGVVDLMIIDCVHVPDAHESLWSTLLERGPSGYSVVLWGGAEAEERCLDWAEISYVSCAGSATPTHVGALCRLILREDAGGASEVARNACG